MPSTGENSGKDREPFRGPVGIVVNPVAGRARADRAAGLLASALAERGLAVETRRTEKPGDGEHLARRFSESGCRLVVAAGGDGTVRETVRGILDAGITLGVLPCGKANDLAGALGLSPRPRETAELIASGATRVIDLGRLRDGSGAHIFCTVAALGFDAEVSAYARESRLRLPGPTVYIWAVLRMLSRYRPWTVTLSGEFGTVREEILLVAIGNSSSYGGGMRIVPEADIADRILDICLIRAVPRRTVLRLLPKLFSGTHVHHPAVRLLRARAPFSISAETEMEFYAEGEPLGRTPAEIDVLPGALRVAAPPPRVAAPPRKS